MKSKKFLSVIMCFALIACMLPYASFSAFADDEIHTSADGSWTYIILEDGTAEIYGAPAYLGSDTELTIPDTIDDYTVTKLSEYALVFCDSIQSVTIGENINEIGIAAFAACFSMGNIYVDSDNPYFSSVDGVLFSKDEKSLLIYPAGKGESTYTVPDCVERIADGAFAYCVGLSGVNLPDGLKSIGGIAFANCESLEQVVLPDTVESIDYDAFYMCTALSSVVLSENLTQLPNSVFGGCTSLTEITIPLGISEIGSEVFAESGMTVITGYWDTAAEQIANDNGYEFISLDTLGDIDYDGSVTIADYAVIKTHLTDDNLKFMKVADYNTDGAIDAFDLFYVDLAVNQQDA